MASSARSLEQMIQNQSIVVGIIGMGYVGLPLALSFVEHKIKVIGFDIDPNKAKQLNDGHCYFRHMPPTCVSSAVSTGRFSATTDFVSLRAADALIICVPTPLTVQREPDLSYVESTARHIQKILRPGHLVILESTTYPGTTDELLKGILDQTGLKCGTDYFLAFSPEREDPGNKTHNTQSIPKVVGGVDKVSGDLAQMLYDQAIAKTVRVASARTAEAVKLTENIFRAINIALVNELKITFDRMDINIWDVIEAASTKPFGFMRFNPGPGWGGHCIPLDPFYLAWKAREFGVRTKFIELAGEINTDMPHYVVNKLQLGLNECGKAVRDSQILLIGMAYKKDIDDTRESPSLEIMRFLDNLGAKCSYHDPFVASVPSTRHSPHKSGLLSVPLDAASVAAFDAVVIVTDHTPVDYGLLARSAKLIVDARGVYDTVHRDLAPFIAKLIRA